MVVVRKMRRTSMLQGKEIKLYGRAKEWVTRKEKTRVVQVGSMKGTQKSDGKGK